MALIPCHFCQAQLEILLPEEGGPPFGAHLQCPECGEVFTLSEERPQLGERPVAGGLQPASYSDAMLAEQLQAEQERQRQYEALIGAEKSPGFVERTRRGLLSAIGSAARVTSGALMVFVILALLTMIFVVGFLVGGDALMLIRSFLGQLN